MQSYFLHANTICCQPPNNELVGAPYEKAATGHCRPNLERVLAEFKPRAVLALGNTALRWFTGQWGIEQLRGYVFESPWGPVVPSYHPSYIMRGTWHPSRVVQLDLLRAVEVAREGVAQLHVEKAYELQPSCSDFSAFQPRAAPGDPADGSWLHLEVRPAPDRNEGRPGRLRQQQRGMGAGMQINASMATLEPYKQIWRMSYNPYGQALPVDFMGCAQPTAETWHDRPHYEYMFKVLNPR